MTSHNDHLIDRIRTSARHARVVPPDPGTVIATGRRRRRKDRLLAEVLALTWDAVNLDGMRLQVRGTLQRTPEGLQVLPPKTERSRRTVPIPPTLAAMLRAHRDTQEARREIAGEAWAAGSTSSIAATVGRSTLTCSGGLPHRSGRAAGLRGVRLHDLRHAFASMQIAEGRNPRLVADLLGHATVAFTLQMYVHPDATVAAEAAETTERVRGASGCGLGCFGSSPIRRSRAMSESSVTSR